MESDNKRDPAETGPVRGAGAGDDGGGLSHHGDDHLLHLLPAGHDPAGDRGKRALRGGAPQPDRGAGAKAGGKRADP